MQWAPLDVIGGRTVPRDFYDRSPQAVAIELLNKLLVCRGRTGRIVEVEAYGGTNDPASHAFRGQTARNTVMFGSPGHLYVYFTYGMHFCCNVVCQQPGEPSAVLIRALAPLAGISEMNTARPNVTTQRYLANGPGKLCQALGIDRLDDGADLVCVNRGVSIVDDGVPVPMVAGQGPRTGIRVATELPWRWWVSDDPHVSPHRSLSG